MKESNPVRDWYRLTAQEALARLGSEAAGLAEDEAARRLERHGPNALPETAGTHPLKVFLHQFTSPLIYLLLVAAAASALLGQHKDAAVIAAVLAINAVIGFLQESRAERSVRALEDARPPRARAPGRPGERVDSAGSSRATSSCSPRDQGPRRPAAARGARAPDRRVHLTGESVPAGKGAAALAEPDLLLGDQRNMAFLGTSWSTAGARGGHRHGRPLRPRRIASRRARGVTAKAPLQQKFHRFARVLGP